MLDDEVVGIEIVPFDGEVFNLSVEGDESYILNEIVAHNCLCYKTSVLMKPDEFTSQLRGWKDGTAAWPAMDQYAAGIGGNVNVDLTGTVMAQALARWATGNREELLRVAH